MESMVNNGKYQSCSLYRAVGINAIVRMSAVILLIFIIQPVNADPSIAGIKPNPELLRNAIEGEIVTDLTIKKGFITGHTLGLVPLDLEAAYRAATDVCLLMRMGDHIRYYEKRFYPVSILEKLPPMNSKKKVLVAAFKEHPGESCELLNQQKEMIVFTQYRLKGPFPMMLAIVRYDNRVDENGALMNSAEQLAGTPKHWSQQTRVWREGRQSMVVNTHVTRMGFYVPKILIRSMMSKPEKNNMLQLLKDIRRTAEQKTTELAH